MKSPKSTITALFIFICGIIGFINGTSHLTTSNNTTPKPLAGYVSNVASNNSSRILQSVGKSNINIADNMNKDLAEPPVAKTPAPKPTKEVVIQGATGTQIH